MEAALYTAERIAKVEKTWSEYAGESIKLWDDMLGRAVGYDAILAWGSELACLRLHYRLGGGIVKKANDGRWYFRKEAMAAK